MKYIKGNVEGIGEEPEKKESKEVMEGKKGEDKRNLLETSRKRDEEEAATWGDAKEGGSLSS